jgi:tRNA threonylcarbamoyl adenosine modification protein (Sua5/YciO/YrdC/YwlC family)
MTVSRVQLKESDRSWLPTALEVLERGDLVVLPTETVYGIAARADLPSALERLATSKGRPAGMAWTWHVGSAEALDLFPSSSPCAARLVERYWPGPLTLVLPGVPRGLELCAHEDWTGVRCTAGEYSQALCEAASFPLAMTSANPHGGEAIALPGNWDALELGDEDLILEGAPQQLPGASTVLKIGPGSFELLREGLHDLDALRKTAGLALGFACTGNTCRSPMAEGIARDAIARRLDCHPGEIGLFGFDVVSMGIFAAAGAPAAAHALETLRDRDIDISDHVSTQATPESVGELDAVFCLTRSHLDALEQMLPPRKAQRLALLDPEGRDIPDPIGGSAEVYRKCADRIADCILARLDDWA